MGWTSYVASHYKGGKIDRIAEVMHDLNQAWRPECGSYRVLKAVAKGSVVYSAVERIKPDGKRLVFGCVSLTSVKGCEFSVKHVDETMGPCECDCPESILKMLTPTEYQNAIKWREKAQTVNARRKELNKLPEGTVIDLATEEAYTCRKEKAHNGSQRMRWYILSADGATTLHCYVRDEAITRTGYTVRAT